MTCSRFSRGQSLVEYLILLAAVATLLTLPLPISGPNGRTAAVYLADCIRSFYQSLTFFISLP
jgi:hypothetical protein